MLLGGTATAYGPGKDKMEFIVWVQLSELQECIYRNFLESEKVKDLLNTSRSPLAALSVLKKVRFPRWSPSIFALSRYFFICFW